MKQLIFILFILSNISLFGQYGTKEYKNYKIEWDSTINKNIIVNTLTQKKTKIDYNFSDYPESAYFNHGLVFVKTGDMKGLMNLDGKKVLKPSHFIMFDDNKKIISAFVCESKTWIFLDFSGDTISFGTTNQKNYVPKINNDLNLAYTITSDKKGLLWGYLDKNANWIIPPKYQKASEFKNQQAEVFINGKRGVIDTAGAYITNPE